MFATEVPAPITVPDPRKALSKYLEKAKKKGREEGGKKRDREGKRERGKEEGRKERRKAGKGKNKINLWELKWHCSEIYLNLIPSQNLIK